MSYLPPLLFRKGAEMMAYKLTDAEMKQLKRLQDKQRTFARKEAAFWKQVDERKDEILAHFGLTEPVHAEGGQASALKPWLQAMGNDI